jgi:hypothetical protein
VLAARGERRARGLAPPSAQEPGGALAGPGDRSRRVTQGIGDEFGDLVLDIGEYPRWRGLAG